MAVDAQWDDVIMMAPLTADILDARGGQASEGPGSTGLSSAVGNAFGAGSAYHFAGGIGFSSDSITYFAASGYTFLDTGDFSVQLAFYPEDGGHGAASESVLFQASAEGLPDYGLRIISDGSANPMNLRIEYHNGSAWVDLIDFVATDISDDAWHWLQVDRVSGVISCYVDGVLYSDETRTASLQFQNISVGDGFNGYIHDVRFTAGAYRVSHAVPTTPWPRPTIQGEVTTTPHDRVIVCLNQNTLAVDGNTVSDSGTGAYTLYPYDYDEHIVMWFDTDTYPIVDGGSGEIMQAYDRVSPGG
jgi:hypothetical protein